MIRLWEWDVEMADKVTVATDVDGAARALRDMAQLTASASCNWDNYEQIALQVLRQVYEAGKHCAKEERP